MFQITNREETFSLNRLNPITIKGYSKSAYRTGYFIKPYNIYLDAGLPYDVPANLVLLSHGHNDHVASLYSILKISNSPVVAMPREIVSPVQHLMNYYNILDTNCRNPFINMSVNHEDSFSIKINGSNMEIDTFRLDHRVPCKAFGISEIKNKLKDEFRDLTGKELGILKKKTNIYDYDKIGVVLFVSDTGKNALSRLPFHNYQIVIIECTFIDDEHYQESIKRKHLHWNDLTMIIKANPDTKFILGHFSTRYKDEFLINFSEEIKDEYPNVIIWI